MWVCIYVLGQQSPRTYSNPHSSVHNMTLTAPHTTTTVEFDLMLPFGSGSYNTLEAIEHDFGGAGVAFPYKLLFVDRSPQPPPANDRCARAL